MRGHSFTHVSVAKEALFSDYVTFGHTILRAGEGYETASEVSQVQCYFKDLLVV